MTNEADYLIQEQIEYEIKSSPIVLFMRGTPTFPQCSGSSKAVNLLNIFGLKYKAIDVLTDNALHQGLKDCGNLDPIPHLYVCKKFIGNHDTLMKMIESGEFESLLLKNKIKHKPLSD